MKVSIVALSPILVCFDALYDALITPMLENAVGQSVWVEMAESGNMSAPVESKLGSLNVPSFVFLGHVSESILEDPISPVEKGPMFPLPAS